MVEVLNSTPEPDGSRKTYFLRVPPDTQTARQGVAWTFGMRPDDYQRLILPLPLDPSVGPLGSPGHPEDDDRAVVLDQVDDAEIADSEPPEVGGRELGHAGWMGVDGQRQDRPAQAGRLTRRESSELTLRGRREDDAPVALAHASSDPYLASVSAASVPKNDFAASPPSRRYSSSAAVADSRSSASSAASSHEVSASSTISRTLRSDSRGLDLDRAVDVRIEIDRHLHAGSIPACWVAGMSTSRAATPRASFVLRARRPECRSLLRPIAIVTAQWADVVDAERQPAHDHVITAPLGPSVTNSAGPSDDSPMTEPA